MCFLVESWMGLGRDCLKNEVWLIQNVLCV